jgi:hypothetical protein
MGKTLKEEFEAERWRGRLALAGVVAIPVLIWAAWSYWPPSTLRDAIKTIRIEELARPYHDQPFQGNASMKWNWVDASRRNEIAAAIPNARDAVEAMLRAAGGRAFLFHPLLRTAFINKPGGAVFVIKLIGEQYAYAARDKDGGPVLDLKSYKVAPAVVVIPLDVLADYATLKHDRGSDYWSVYIFPDLSRAHPNEILMYDAPAAVAYGQKGRP